MRVVLRGKGECEVDSRFRVRAEGEDGNGLSVRVRMSIVVRRARVRKVSLWESMGRVGVGVRAAMRARRYCQPLHWHSSSNRASSFRSPPTRATRSPDRKGMAVK